jgi:hypothetical protein
MATIYSTQYANGYITVPRVANVNYGTGYQHFPWDYTYPGAGNIGDVLYLATLPPYATVVMLASAFWFAGATATETIDIGWLAYTDGDGTAVVADADGLIDGVLMTTDATWRGGALITAAAIAQSLPIVNVKTFNNRTPVVLTATFLVAAPGAADTINGYFSVISG